MSICRVYKDHLRRTSHARLTTFSNAPNPDYLFNLAASHAVKLSKTPGKAWAVRQRHPRTDTSRSPRQKWR